MPRAVFWPGAAGLLIKITSAAAYDANKFEAFRFVITRTRNPASRPYVFGVTHSGVDSTLAGDTQLAQLILYEDSGARIPLCNALGSGTSPRNEEPDKLVDDNVHTKWFVQGPPGEKTIQFDVKGDAVVVSRYRLVTANDCPGRDPIRWRLEGRPAKKTSTSAFSLPSQWQVLDDRTASDIDQAMPEARHQAADFAIAPAHDNREAPTASSPEKSSCVATPSAKRSCSTEAAASGEQSTAASLATVAMPAPSSLPTSTPSVPIQAKVEGAGQPEATVEPESAVEEQATVSTTPCLLLQQLAGGSCDYATTLTGPTPAEWTSKQDAIRAPLTPLLESTARGWGLEYMVDGPGVRFVWAAPHEVSLTHYTSRSWPVPPCLL